MSDSRVCAHCGAGCDADLVICWGCARSIRQLLREVPWLLTRLGESAYGQAKVAPRGAVKAVTAEVPGPPLNGRAADLLRDAGARLSAWGAQVLVDPPDSPVAVARALRAPGAFGAPMAAYRWAADALKWLTQWRSDALEAIDLPPELQYVGECGSVQFDTTGREVVCGARLYAPRGDVYVTCPRCGWPWPVDEMQQAMLDRVDGELKSAADMFRLLKWVGREVPRSSFYKLMAGVPCRAWRDGDRVVPAPGAWPSASAVPLYAYGDVVAGVDGWERARAERAELARLRREERERRERDALLTEQQSA
ncbi:helix-turn-helix DNA binding domain protein [Mycobacterium phage MalagasyRose]|uniref:Helix-turn-helix DNA binding domain protein n=1 Tax=Mycobacterium phage MalagasyRose TaxID=2599870 RepID=A0A5J6TGN4_9CAUD|nr:helix-turn-helix DNA binding domain protein [Mycobacterium phage MalagasyRose]QFG08919.1 helix-turn-helix DNA binding domain protein [Mycobacterium phage MalagasyRose]